MPLLNFGKREKSIEELEEETEILEAENRRTDNELSLEQKRVAIARLKEHGLKPSHFPDWSSALRWIKSH